MALADYVLFQLSQRWPKRLTHSYGDDALDRGVRGSDEYRLAYAHFQFNRKVRYGLGHRVWDLDVLEVGCGHGGICCFMALAGARSVTGIDLNTANLATARQFALELQSRLGSGTTLPVTFAEMRAEETTFAENSFDLVIADNLFEHVDDPLSVLREAHRVLRPGGRLVAPNMLSILAKNGLHLKYGLKVPWTNLVFSDRTIIRTLRRIADQDPKMFEVYPGLRGDCVTIRDVRRYKDLNGLTYADFRRMASEAKFEVSDFSVASLGYAGKILNKVPLIRRSVVADILSAGASAVLRKPAVPMTPEDSAER